MIKRIWLGFCLLCYFGPLMAAPTVFMEAHLLNENGENTDSLTVKVGQRVTLAVDILTTTWFTRAPEIQPMTLRGAINLQSQQFGTNYSTNRQGTSYAVQRREITIFPQRAGQFITPSQVAKVWVAGESGERLAEQNVRSEPLVFQVEAISAEETQHEDVTSNLLVAEDLLISESFEPSLATLTEDRSLYTGDAIIRRVSLKAKGTLGMLIKPLAWQDIPGVGQQASRAEVSDRTNRGEFTGIRVETRSYVFEQDGEFILPAITVYWWDQTQQALSEVSLPQHTITVAQGGMLSAGDAVAISDENGLRNFLQPWMIIAVVALVALLLLSWVGLNLVRLLQRRYAIYRQGERYKRRVLLKACAHGDRDHIMRSFYGWFDHLAIKEQQSPLMQELQQAITDYYQIYYQLEPHQHKDRLTRLVQSIHAIPHREAQQHKRPWFSRRLPQRRMLADLNP
ncbi:hypothetical protein R50073_02100 [Maricurvus nonylphenolicus]|uniref:hypothetical protein n=1 Tax=Maricurvus nonylphenolicus TaxID=1008307 RepID=UPI0036F2FB84